MKKALKLLALAAVAAVVLSVLVSCGSGLNGTYESASVLGIKSVYTFKGDTVTWSISGAAETTGTYKIDDDKITITVAGSDLSFSFAKDGDKITIEGVEYTKAD